MLVRKEVELRRKNRGTLHRSAPKQHGREKWSHASYKGWITFEKSLGGVCVAAVQSRDPDAEWQLSQTFVGFVLRHFRAEVSSVYLNLDASE